MGYTVAYTLANSFMDLSIHYEALRPVSQMIRQMLERERP